LRSETIPDKNKLQLYPEQIYACNKFDKQEMLAWEQQLLATKQDYAQARTYFETIIKDTDTYKQNSGSKPQRYESANQLANLGDEVRGYIQQISGNNTTEGVANVQTK
jgi:hypothetical protein